MAHIALYPSLSRESLRKQFVGKSIKDVATPAAVLDLAVTKRNCTKMLDAVSALGFGWRAHVKTHKGTTLHFAGSATAHSTAYTGHLHCSRHIELDRMLISSQSAHIIFIQFYGSIGHTMTMTIRVIFLKKALTL